MNRGSELWYPPEASGGYFGLAFATPPRVENFGINALRGKLHQLGSPNLQDIFIGGIRFSGKEISLILKNKMAAAGISLKIIYVFLLAVSHRLNVFIGDMYNRYICPLQPCRHLTLKLLIQGHPQSAKVTHIADFKSAYISLIIAPGGLGW